MAKMYYTEIEAAGKLAITPAQLTGLVRQGKLHVYADGTNRMFKVTEVDALSGGEGSSAGSKAGTKAGESDIQLSPADGSRAGAPAGKQGDTVITSEGISVFDDEDLEIETADPMAKTQIAPTLDEGISLDGAQGGTGLLDLTRESDDTSLGAVLEHIDVEGGGGAAVESSVGDEVTEEAEPVTETVYVMADRPDPSAGAFSGLLVVGALVMILLSTVGLAVTAGKSPAYMSALAANLPIVVGVIAVLAIIAAVVGHAVGKGSRPAARRA